LHIYTYKNGTLRDRRSRWRIRIASGEKKTRRKKGLACEPLRRKRGKGFFSFGVVEDNEEHDAAAAGPL
jgi:hypothetical protein